MTYRSLPGTRGRLPFPRFLLPVSEFSEYEDETGVFHFDVAILLPWRGMIARYVDPLRSVDDFHAARNWIEQQ